jgi:uncharacterized protein YecT (DUF1311 family)
MRRKLPALCLVLLFQAAPAWSLECDPSDETQMGLNMCAAAKFNAEDARLNTAYREIMKRLTDDAAGRQALQKAQRAWIGFRDAECAFSTAGTEGGSIHPMMVSQCLAAFTAARTEQLGGYLGCQEGDLSCPVPPAP